MSHDHPLKRASDQDKQFREGFRYFARKVLEDCIAPRGSTEFVMGIGSGIVALHVAKLSAANFFVVELLQDIVNIAQRHVEEKHLEHRIMITSILDGFRCNFTPDFVIYAVSRELCCNACRAPRDTN